MLYVITNHAFAIYEDDGGITIKVSASEILDNRVPIEVSAVTCLNTIRHTDGLVLLHLLITTLKRLLIRLLFDKSMAGSAFKSLSAASKHQMYKGWGSTFIN
jgi:hypothetical protein